MQNKGAVALLRELAACGHTVRVDGNKLLITPATGVALSEEHRAAIPELKEGLVALLRDRLIREAMLGAVDSVALLWPQKGEQPQPSMQIIVAEAAMDTACKAEPLDLTAALDSINVWRTLWVALLRGRKASQ